MKKNVFTEKAPQAIGPYSQAIIANNMVYTSGQLGMDEKGVLKETVEEQAQKALENLKAVLEEAGTTMDNIVKTTVFLADINDFVKVNQIYGKFFNEPYPARSAVQVANLPKAAKVEIEAIAIL
ncbi:reactive intermediate/imine deaminase [Sporanaerobium hydrogeniformans]|uniref:Reactive intermediate/imine deaminase n=1 Tax=Sporanaerobium hydrogeniformans TaxID=3072179 RepID=A0AC61DC38_9FIRM|nr:RidA family protein [Sporanaerobium hydrogeniformans]PHV70849.1 reactive intermediate/imine deaminase [Sporanaerobium hydrogeniformans]